MGLNQERDQLKRSNPSKKWANQVDLMSDKEVSEIYYRLRSKGELKK